MAEHLCAVQGGLDGDTDVDSARDSGGLSVHCEGVALGWDGACVVYQILLRVWWK